MPEEDSSIANVDYAEPAPDVDEPAKTAVEAKPASKPIPFIGVAATIDVRGVPNFQ